MLYSKISSSPTRYKFTNPEMKGGRDKILYSLLSNSFFGESPPYHDDCADWSRVYRVQLRSEVLRVRCDHQGSASARHVECYSPGARQNDLMSRKGQRTKGDSKWFDTSLARFFPSLPATFNQLPLEPCSTLVRARVFLQFIAYHRQYRVLLFRYLRAGYYM